MKIPATVRADWAVARFDRAAETMAFVHNLTKEDAFAHLEKLEAEGALIRLRNFGLTTVGELMDILSNLHESYRDRPIAVHLDFVI